MNTEKKTVGEGAGVEVLEELSSSSEVENDLEDVSSEEEENKEKEEVMSGDKSESVNESVEEKQEEDDEEEMASIKICGTMTLANGDEEIGEANKVGKENEMEVEAKGGSETVIKQQEEEIDALHEENLKLQKELKEEKNKTVDQQRTIEQLREELAASRKKEERWKVKCGKLERGLTRVKEMNLAINGLIDKGLDCLDKDERQVRVKKVKSEQPEVSQVQGPSSSSVFRRSERIFLNASLATCKKEEEEIGEASEPVLASVSRAPATTTFNKKSSQSQAPVSMKCSHCCLRFYHRFQLKRHVNKFHKKKLTMPKLSKQVPVSFSSVSDVKLEPPQLKKLIEHEPDMGRMKEGYFCVCGHKASSEMSLRMHARYFKVGKQFQCSVCPKKCFSTGDLTKHMKNRHKINYEKTNGCRNCGATFATRASLFLHMKNVHNNGPTRRKLKTGKYKDESLSVAEEEFPDPVPIPLIIEDDAETGMGVTEEDTLITDQVAEEALLNLKTDVKPILKPLPRNEMDGDGDACIDVMDFEPVVIKLENDNDYYWCDPDSEDNHQVEDDEPSSVEVLGIVKNPKNVKVESHDPLSLSGLDESSLGVEHGEGKGNWCLCGIEFSNKQSLLTHVRTKVGVKPFKCHICGEAFPRADYMKIHVNNQHGILLPSHLCWCTVCGLQLDSRRHLIQHRFDVHNDGPKAKSRGPRKRRKIS